jgi:Bardet-Biedl syndrome 4 protein
MHVISPNSYELWNNVGLCMMNKNKNLAAYCCLRKAVFLDPL